MTDTKTSGKGTTIKNLVVLAVTAVVVLVGVWVVHSMRSGGEDEGVVGAQEEHGATDGETTDAMSPSGAGDDATPVEIEGAKGPLAVGEPAPAFSARTLAGEEVDLKDLEGKPVWLLFNATWCADCRAEIPDVIEAYDDYSEKVEVLSVYVSDSKRAVEEYSENLDIPYPQVVDETNRVAAQYGVVGLPTSVFINSDGVVDEVRVGALSPSAMQQKLKDLSG